MAQKPKKALNLMIPAELHDSFSKLCVGWGITKTEAIAQYIKYLRSLERHQRKPLHAKAPLTFTPAPREPE